MAKDQDNFLKDQINVNNNNNNNNYRENDLKVEADVKVEDGEIDNMSYRCIDKKYKDLISNIFIYELKEKDLHLRDFNNEITGLQNIVNTYLMEKYVGLIEEEFDFKKSFRNLVAIDYMID